MDAPADTPQTHSLNRNAGARIGCPRAGRRSAGGGCRLLRDPQLPAFRLPVLKADSEWCAALQQETLVQNGPRVGGWQAGPRRARDQRNY
jgi:hypothetical protein